MFVIFKKRKKNILNKIFRNCIFLLFSAKIVKKVKRFFAIFSVQYLDFYVFFSKKVCAYPQSIYYLINLF